MQVDPTPDSLFITFAIRIVDDAWLQQTVEASKPLAILVGEFDLMLKVATVYARKSDHLAMANAEDRPPARLSGEDKAHQLLVTADQGPFHEI